MDNSRFSSLVFQIIGKPERWHNDYLDVMHQVLDEMDSFESPTNFSELAIGDEILNRISNTNEALMALNSLMDNSRFKIIILDECFNLVYHNQNAHDLFQFLKHPKEAKKLSLSSLNKIKEAKQSFNTSGDSYSIDGLIASGLKDKNNEIVYLRTIQNKSNETKPFHVLLCVNQSAQSKELNTDFSERFELTSKEQKTLIALTHGSSIKDIALNSFVSENTVKTHLKSLFRKTQTNSQTEIVTLVLTHESQILDSYFATNESAPRIQQFNNSLDKFITLKSGFKIAYREYGPKDGTPIIVCHNGYGCRVSIPADYQSICERQNKRIIIPDRPGYGLTAINKGHPFEWNKMLGEFIDELGINEYEMLGTVLGSTFAINYALEACSRLKRLRLSSPVYVNVKQDTRYLNGILAPVSRLIKASKRFAIEIYELWLKSVTIDLNKHYRSMLEDGLGTQEQVLFSKDNTIDLMVESFREGSSQCLEGISNEMAYCLSPQKVDLSQITIPVDLWWGSQDNRVTLEGVENLASQLPNSNVQIREGFSEYIYYGLFEEIISD